MTRINKPFTFRRSLLALGALVGGLIIPATSLAATRLPCSPKSQATCEIKTTTVPSGRSGFDLNVIFHQGIPTGYGGRISNSVAGILFKHSSQGIENDNYTFTAGKNHPLKFSLGSSTKPLQFAKITGTFASVSKPDVHIGGSINLTFHATGPLRTHKVLCKGAEQSSYKTRSGTLSADGTNGFVLHADNFGMITHKTFKATISTATYTCNKPTHGYEVQTIGYLPAYVDVFKNAANKVSELMEVLKGGSNGWTVTHKYTVSGLPSTDYNIKTTTNLKNAFVTGGGAISGTAAYSSKSTKAKTNQTAGTMKGTLAVTFASLGHVVHAFPKVRGARQSHS